MSEDRLLSAADVAERLHVSTDFVYAMARERRIPHVRLGRTVRFRWADVERWLDAQARKAA